jgi:predicted DNA-binding helix-hairpin-helix protein
MVDLLEKLESSPRLIALSQIEVPQNSFEAPKASPEIKRVVQSLREQKFNVSLPIVCITEEEDKYRLLTGLQIFEAAKLADLPRLWVFLIAETKSESAKILEQASLQSKLNQAVIDLQDVQKFVDFLNKAKEVELTKIPGIKEKSAKRIQSKRPFKSAEDLKKLGPKQSIKWLHTYLQSL